jgi:hypothetical protein
MGLTHRIKIRSHTHGGLLEVPAEAVWHGIPLDMIGWVYVGGATRYPQDRYKQAVPARTPTKRAKT